MEGVRRDRNEDGLRPGRRTDGKRRSQRDGERSIESDRQTERERERTRGRKKGRKSSRERVGTERQGLDGERDSEGEEDGAIETVGWGWGGGSRNRKLMGQNRARTDGEWDRR